jgi:DNA-binding MarR family transcriptional regulator
MPRRVLLVNLSSGPTIGYLVWRLAMRWQTACDRVVAPMGLTQAQYSLLASLYGFTLSGARPSQRELADYTGLDPIFVSKLARALESRGLLRRDVHPSDSRAVQLTLTEDGVSAIVPAVAAVRELQEEITAPLGGTRAARTAEFADALRILLSAADAPGGAHSTDISHHGSRNMSSTSTQTPDTNTSAATAQPLPPLTGQHIGTAANATRAILDTVLGAEQTTFPVWVALRTLDTRGPYASRAAFETALVEGLAVEPSAVAETVDELFWQGHVAQDADGVVALSDSGQTLYNHLNARVTATAGQLYSDLDHEEMVVAARVLKRITDRANELRATLAA